MENGGTYNSLTTIVLGAVVGLWSNFLFFVDTYTVFLSRRCTRFVQNISGCRVEESEWPPLFSHTPSRCHGNTNHVTSIQFQYLHGELHHILSSAFLPFWHWQSQIIYFFFLAKPEDLSGSPNTGFYSVGRTNFCDSTNPVFLITSHPKGKILLKRLKI